MLIIVRNWRDRSLGLSTGADLGGGCRGCASPPSPEMSCGFLVLCQKKTMWFIGVEVEQETSAPPPKKILDPRRQFYGHLSIMSSNEYLILASKLRLRFALLNSQKGSQRPRDRPTCPRQGVPGMKNGG